MDKKTALLYAKMPEYKYIVNKTNGFIKWALNKVKNPYIACSFGKDSAVMLHLILQYKPDIDVVWITFPETKYLNNYYEIAKIWANKYHIKLNEVYIDIPPDVDFDDKTAFPKNPYDSYFVGITKDESVGRRISIKRHGMFYLKKDKMIRVCPLADWKVKHIAAYCLSNDLPILDSYFHEGFESRTVTGFTENINAFRLNQLTELKHRDFTKYNLLLKDCPNLKNYV